MVFASERTKDRTTPTRKPKSAARRRLHVDQPRPSDLFAFAGVAAPRLDVTPPFDPRKLIKFALGIFHASIDARHAVLFERWTAAQNLHLPDDLDGDVLRFHPRLKNGDDRAPGLIWLLRDVLSDEPTGIVRYFLDSDGVVIARKALGRVYGTAIKLSADADVAEGLHIASSVERGVAAMQAGLRPMWVVNALADFPLIPGIEALTIITDDADADAVAQCAARWTGAGRMVRIVSTNNETPPRDIEPHGGDP